MEQRPGNSANQESLHDVAAAIGGPNRRTSLLEGEYGIESNSVSRPDRRDTHPSSIEAEGLFGCQALFRSG
jgi:hypothetical protein